MLYLPKPTYHQQLNLLQRPVPPKLLNWLHGEKGVAMIVLPLGPENAKRVLLKRFRGPSAFAGDGRVPWRTSHYNILQKQLVLSCFDFWHRHGSDVYLHELGHAIDHNLGTIRHPFHTRDYVWKALRPNKPLNKYCKDKQKQNGLLSEQWACAFAAYFHEKRSDSVTPNNISDLSPELIRIIRDEVLGRFK